MSTLTLTLKLPFYRLNQCKALEFERLTKLNTGVANQLLEIPKKERAKLTSKDFSHVEIGSMWINQTIRNACAATKVKQFKRLPLEVNNQGWKVIKVGDTYSVSFSLLRGVKKRVPLSVHQASHQEVLDKLLVNEAKMGSLKVWKSKKGIWYALLSVSMEVPDTQKSPRLIGLVGMGVPLGGGVTIGDLAPFGLTVGFPFGSAVGSLGFPVPPNPFPLVGLALLGLLGELNLS